MIQASSFSLIAALKRLIVVAVSRGGTLNFNKKEVSCVELIVESVLKRQNSGEVLAARQLLDVPAMFVERDSMSLVEAKSPVPQFLASQNLTYLEENRTQLMRKL